MSHGDVSTLYGAKFLFGAKFLITRGNIMNPLVVIAMFPVAFLGLIAVAALNGM